MTQEAATPIDGLRHFIATHRAMLSVAKAEPKTRAEHLVAEWKCRLHLELRQETKDKFLALLDAMDTYLTEEVAPRYANQNDTRTSLDAYWHNRSEMYTPHHHILPPTPNGLRVARSYIDMVLDHLEIGKDTEAFKAVEAASDAFYVNTYGHDKSGQRAGTR